MPGSAKEHVRLTVSAGAVPLIGSVPAPPHRGLAQMVMAVAALGPVGASVRIAAKGLGELPMQAALTALGVAIDADSTGVVVTSVGRDGLQTPDRPIDVGGSLEALALVAGLIAGAGLKAELTCDESLGIVALEGIARVLRARGAQLEATFVPEHPGLLRPPLVFEASGPLAPLEQHPVLPDAYGDKLAALMSGLLAGGTTTVIEPVICRDVFVRWLRALSLTVNTAGAVTMLEPPPSDIPALPETCSLPGDLDMSLMLLAAALSHPDSRIAVRHVISQPSDAAALTFLRESGARLDVSARGPLLGQEVADVTALGERPRGLHVDGERAARSGTSLATLAAWAALATGDSELTGLTPAAWGAERSRAAQPPTSDEGARVARVLAGFGVPAHWDRRTATLRVTGGTFSARSGDVTRTIDATGDGRIAMLATALAMSAPGTTHIDNAESIVAHFPRFVGSLRALGADVRVTTMPEPESISP